MTEPSEIDTLIRAALAEVTMLMARAFSDVGGTPVPGSALDQEGLRNGHEIVEDYLRHGEAGVAFEHLLYMIKEPGLPISPETLALINRAGRVLGMTPKF